MKKYIKTLIVFVITGLLILIVFAIITRSFVPKTNLDIINDAIVIEQLQDFFATKHIKGMHIDQKNQMVYLDDDNICDEKCLGINGIAIMRKLLQYEISSVNFSDNNIYTFNVANHIRGYDILRYYPNGFNITIPPKISSNEELIRIINEHWIHSSLLSS